MHRHHGVEWKILVRAILARHVSKGDLVGDGVGIGDDASISHENMNPGNSCQHLSGLWEALLLRLTELVLGRLFLGNVGQTHLGHHAMFPRRVCESSSLADASLRG